MENKETINQTSFSEKISAFFTSIETDVNKYKYDIERHRALLVFASDLNDNDKDSVRSYIYSCGKNGDIIRLLNGFISSYPLSHQEMILDTLLKCYEQRKNGK